jgi:hypothetical protein
VGEPHHQGRRAQDQEPRDSRDVGKLGQGGHRGGARKDQPPYLCDTALATAVEATQRAGELSKRSAGSVENRTASTRKAAPSAG